jgi:hypothetical protein
MHNLKEIKRRFMKNNLPVRLGCIASNLARLQSFSKMPNNRKVIESLIEESKFFIEWAVPKASLGIQEELVNIQLQLALCSFKKEILNCSGKWAERLIKLSGLLKK